MRSALLCSVAMAVVVLVSASAFGALTPGQKLAAEALIKQFSAPEFAARQQAVDKLIALGGDVAPLVRKALAETNDNEVKLRCRMVLKGVGAAVDGERPKGAVNYDASKVTIEAREAPLSDVLAELAEKSGNPPIDAGRFKDRAVTVGVKDVPYFQALDAVCKSAGVLCVKFDPRTAPALQDAPKPDAPDAIGYAGPAVIRLNQAERVKTDRRVLIFRSSAFRWSQPTGPQQSLNVTASYAIEERLPALGCRVEFRKAIAPDGTDLLKAQTAAALARDAELAKRLGDYRAPSYMMDPSAGAFIPDTPEGIKGPLTLDGIIRITFAVGKKEVRIDKVFAGEKKTVETDGVTLELTSGVRGGASGTVSFVMKGDPKKGQNVNNDTRTGFGFAVVDERGKQVGRRTQWSQESDDKESRITIKLADLPADAGDLALVYSWPESVVTKEYPFTIKDVPLP